jgi:hypothetical protein
VFHVDMMTCGSVALPRPTTAMALTFAHWVAKRDWAE